MLYGELMNERIDIIRRYTRSDLFLYHIKGINRDTTSSLYCLNITSLFETNFVLPEIPLFDTFRPGKVFTNATSLIFKATTTRTGIIPSDLYLSFFQLSTSLNRYLTTRFLDYNRIKPAFQSTIKPIRLMQAEE